MQNLANFQNHLRRTCLFDIIVIVKTNMSVKIEKSKRKTISLQVLNVDAVLVKAPLKCGDKKIWQFVNSKKSWIAKQIESLKKKQDFAKRFDFENYTYLLGEIHEKQKLSYKQNANKILPKIAEDLASRLGYCFSKLSIKPSKRRWGSYSSKKELMLNIYCVILPLNLVEYVIIHELCHSKEMNHSPKFWKLVEKHFPDYKLRKKQLENYSFLLNLKLT